MPQFAFDVDREGMTLRGSAYVPASRKRLATVVLLHGFTGQRIETGFLFVQVARALSDKGLAAITFDFMHSGESDGSFDQMLVTGEVSDAARITQWAQTQSFVDRSRMGVLGFSLGGLVAACLMGRSQAYKALALLAPTTVENLCRYTGDPTCSSQGGVNRGALTLHARFFEDLKTLDPLRDCVKHPRPTLLVQGTGDTVVKPEVSQRYLEALKSASIPADVRLIDGADHGFATPHHRREVVEALVSWLASRL